MIKKLKIHSFFNEKIGLKFSHFFGLLVGLLAFFSTSPVIHTPAVYLLFISIGLLLTTLGAFGRVWSELYLAGFKRKKLISEGPFSIMRHPNYTFNFFALTGIAIGSGSLSFILFFLVLCLLIYPYLARLEEQDLSNLNREYVDYKKQTPAFIPKVSLLKSPEEYTTRPKTFSRTLFTDIMRYYLIFVLMLMVRALQSSGFIPTFLEIP